MLNLRPNERIFHPHCIKYFDLSCTLKWSLTYQASVFWKMLIHWIMQIFQMLTHYNIWYQKSQLSIIAIDVISKVFKYWKAVKLMHGSRSKFSKTLIFAWMLHFYHWQQILSVIFFEVTVFLVYFWVNVCQIPKSE